MSTKNSGNGTKHILTRVCNIWKETIRKMKLKREINIFFAIISTYFSYHTPQHI